MKEDSPLPDVNGWVQICNDTEILNFEQFSLVKNNFCLHFATNWIGRLYRSQAPYQKCLEVRSGFRELSYRLRGRRNKRSCNYTKKLYRAYLMMRPYATSNWEMFQ